MQSRGKVLFLLEVALFVALGVILDLFSFRAWLQGSSISLQMVPIFIMSYRWGWRGGLTTGFVYGLVQLVTGAYIIHPIQALIDYVLSFVLVGLCAITANVVLKSIKQNNQLKASCYVVIGCLIGSLGRFIMHNVAAIIFFASFAPPNQPVWLYATIYNASYVFPSFIVSSVIMVLLVQMRPKLIFFHK